ncbi:MAG: hypothetical protein M3404_12010, partial [Actinomycetota bacterium]|nr:hypothetical protein [Actinomycetota bacterium]
MSAAVLGLVALTLAHTSRDREDQDGHFLCGVADLKSVTAPTSPPPANAVHKVAGGFSVSSLTVANNEVVS